LGNACDRVPRLFAHFEEKSEFYLVQEYINGHPLSTELISGQPWAEASVAQLLTEIVEILAVVHQHNVIHRDIKPQNLMRRSHNKKIVLIDFGAVKEISALTIDTQGHTTSADTLEMMTRYHFRDRYQSAELILSSLAPTLIAERSLHSSKTIIHLKQSSSHSFLQTAQIEKTQMFWPHQPDPTIGLSNAIKFASSHERVLP
jgi:serine/threonine protein kinase